MRLNLLPPEKKLLLVNAHRLRVIQRISAAWMIGLLIVTGSLFMTQRVLNGKLSRLQAEYASLESPEGKGGASAETLVRSLNAQLATLDTALRNYQSMTDLIMAFAVTVPPGVHLSQLAIGTDGTVSVEGIATERDDFLGFKANLEASPRFTNIQSPLSTILLKENIRFELTAAVEQPKAVP